MEVISGLVLILLSSVGARNIPAHMDQRLELPQVSDDLSSYTKTSADTIIPTGDLVESVVVVEDLGLHFNKNAEEDEKIEDHVYSVVNVDTDIKMNNQKVRKHNQIEEMDSVLRPAEEIEVQNIKKTKEWLLECRDSFKTPKLPCPEGTIGVGNGRCWQIASLKRKKSVL